MTWVTVSSIYILWSYRAGHPGLTAVNKELKWILHSHDGPILEDDKSHLRGRPDAFSCGECAPSTLNLSMRYTQLSADGERPSISEYFIWSALRLPCTEASDNSCVLSSDKYAGQNVQPYTYNINVHLSTSFVPIQFGTVWIWSWR